MNILRKTLKLIINTKDNGKCKYTKGKALVEYKKGRSDILKQVMKKSVHIFLFYAFG